MLDRAAVHAGATAISVGPEPAGAPPEVLHLGGGPVRFCEMLEEQLAAEARLGPFATPRDASWIIEESGFDVAREHEIESLLAISNGYLGSRGSIAEGSSVSRPATFLAGAFEPSNDYAKVPELVILPDWGRIRVSVEGEPLSVERGSMRPHRRILDMRRGLLLREGVAHAETGHVTSLRTVHAASLSMRHLLLEGIELTPENYSGSVRLDAILSGEVKSASGASHWAGFTPVGGEEGPILVGRTHCGLTAALASRTRTGNRGAVVARSQRATAEASASEICDLELRLAEPSEIYREVSVFTSRDSSNPRADAARFRHAAGSRDFADLVREHGVAWGAPLAPRGHRNRRRPALGTSAALRRLPPLGDRQPRGSEDVDRRPRAHRRGLSRPRLLGHRHLHGALLCTLSPRRLRERRSSIGTARSPRRAAQGERARLRGRALRLGERRHRRRGDARLRDDADGRGAARPLRRRRASHQRRRRLRRVGLRSRHGRHHDPPRRRARNLGRNGAFLGQPRHESPTASATFAR